MPSSKPCKSGQVRYDNRCRTFDKDELYKMSPSELRSIAKKLEIPKYSLMNTTKLMKEIYLYKYDCKPPKVWDTTDRSSPKCRDRRKSPKYKGYSESKRKCSPPMVYDQDDHSCRSKKTSPRNKGYAEAMRKCSPPMVWDRETHECRARKFRKSMNEKVDDIKQDTKKLKGTVKKIYQLSDAIDSTRDKGMKAKLEKARSSERFKAQQQAAAVTFEQRKAEIRKKDFDVKSRELEKKLDFSKRPSNPSAPPERDVIAEEKVRLSESVMKIQQTTEAKIHAAEASLDEVVNKQSFITRQGGKHAAFYKNTVLPVEIKYRAEREIRGCQTAFLESQMQALNDIETLQGFKELETLILQELNKCRQLHEGRVGKVIAERRAELEIEAEASEVFEDAEQIEVELDQSLPNFIEENEENEQDLTPQQIESRKYRAARKASPQLARERRQSPTIMGDIKRYGLGRYRGLEDDYEIPQV